MLGLACSIGSGNELSKYLYSAYHEVQRWTGPPNSTEITHCLSASIFFYVIKRGRCSEKFISTLSTILQMSTSCFENGSLNYIIFCWSIFFKHNQISSIAPFNTINLRRTTTLMIFLSYTTETCFDCRKHCISLGKSYSQNFVWTVHRRHFSRNENHMCIITFGWLYCFRI